MLPMKFKSRKDILFQVVVFGSSGFIIGLFVWKIYSDPFVNFEFICAHSIGILTAALLLWLYFDTSYELTPTDLKYKNGPIRGKIKMEQIKEVIKGKSLWSGLKPATARKGLIIKHWEYNEIYIRPKTNNTFVKKLLELNNKIKITKK
jgi:hypothetical protein